MGIQISEFLALYEQAKVNTDAKRELTDRVWYDWFCKEHALPAKTMKLGAKLKELYELDGILLPDHHVFFKNNCPMNGNLYDSISVKSVTDQEVLWWVCPKNGHKGSKFGNSEVTDIRTMTEISGTWEDVKKFFRAK